MLWGGKQSQESEEAVEEVVCYDVISQAAPGLVPVLLELIQWQEEGQEPSDELWNTAAAGGMCLRLVVNTAGDLVLPLIVPFIQVIIGRLMRNCNIGFC